MTDPGNPVTIPGNPAASIELRGTPLAGAAALVTGGHRGIGRALVNEFLSRGAAKVYATSREPRTVDDKRLIPILLDVTDEESVSAAAAAAQDVSIVVNNAGVFLATDVLEAPLKDIQAELETNLFGLIRDHRHRVARGLHGHRHDIWPRCSESRPSRRRPAHGGGHRRREL